MVVALADEPDGNCWRKVDGGLEVKQQVLDVADVIYADAGGDEQKAISDLNGLVAQGVNVIVVNADSGAALLPAIQAATEAGVSVRPEPARVLVGKIGRTTPPSSTKTGPLLAAGSGRHGWENRCKGNVGVS